jgi:hypothetical protein
MKYKDTFIRYYILNPLIGIRDNILVKLNYWWCADCGKYHSNRVKHYWNQDNLTCIEENEKLSNFNYDYMKVR